MILLLHGEDSYTSRKKLEEFKAKFIEKNSDINLSVFDGSELSSLMPVKEAIETTPFLGSKRMIVIYNFLSQNKKEELGEEMIKLIDKVPEESFVIFYEGDTADKRTRLFKKLNIPGRSQEFKPIPPYQLSKWIKNRIKELKGSITDDAVTELSVLISSNLWQLEQELQKLVLYKHGTDNAITSDDVKEFVHGSISSNIFKMIDYLGQKKTSLAAEELTYLKQSGNNEIYLLSMIVYQFRNLIQARDILNQGGSQYDLSKRAKLHPFVAAKSLKQADNFTLDELKAIYQKLMEMDIGMKTGRLDPSIALDTFVVAVGIK